ncbi:hypothetical protein ACFW4G_28065 [Paenibacillus lactis]|uniref:hypothetical protein n=1 Tax=Paenibacillus TaxID=44249 RepID=UPI0011A0219D|nr:hypothetical protein [Paenibacillus sp. IHBB 10380]
MRKGLENEEAFRDHLSRILNSERLLRDCISRCRRVEHWEGVLVNHYNDDQGRTLLERLTYSKEDAEHGLDPKHNIPIKGNKGYDSIYEGTASLRNAVKLYLDFLSKHPPIGSPSDKVRRTLNSLDNGTRL